MNKKLLILTGPQGAGNHLWSKIVSHTRGVAGWSQLTRDYFVSHSHEPFTELWWKDASLFSKIEWTEQYYMTSISCPLGGFAGSDQPPPKIPNYDEFILEARKAGFDVKLAVIGRDFNILAHQQQRLRKLESTPRFLEELDQVLMKHDPVFISTELLYLYRHRYIQQVSKLLEFPMKVDPEILENILKDNSNAKYIQPVEHYWLDDVHRASWNQPRDSMSPSHKQQHERKK
jgi:hypothetical protein